MRKIARSTRRNFNSVKRSQTTDKIFLAPSIVDVKLKNSKPVDNCNHFVVEWQMEDGIKDPKRRWEFSK